jgi:hypothetical protein
VTFEKQVTKTAIINRVQFMTELLTDGMDETKSPRLFTRSPEIIAKLWQRQDCICPLCNQTIHESRMNDEEYTHIDHIQPHSKGGKTIDSNSQLVHRYCNLSKGNRE